MNIFSETRFSQLDDDNLYHIKDYTLLRNDDTTRVSQNPRPFGGMAVYSRLDYYYQINPLPPMSAKWHL